MPRDQDRKSRVSSRHPWWSAIGGDQVQEGDWRRQERRSGGRTLGVSREDTVGLCVRELTLAAVCAGV